MGPQAGDAGAGWRGRGVQGACTAVGWGFGCCPKRQTTAREPGERGLHCPSWLHISRPSEPNFAHGSRLHRYFIAPCSGQRIQPHAAAASAQRRTSSVGRGPCSSHAACAELRATRRTMQPQRRPQTGWPASSGRLRAPCKRGRCVLSQCFVGCGSCCLLPLPCPGSHGNADPAPQDGPRTCACTAAAPAAGTGAANGPIRPSLPLSSPPLSNMAH